MANQGSNSVSILINLTAETGIGDHNDATELYPALLSQNYPNPFNAGTTIRHVLLQPSDVRIEIYDILGRKVGTLAEGIMLEGTHQVVWDASSQASGIYLYRIKAGDNVETKRMTLLK